MRFVFPTGVLLSMCHVVLAQGDANQGGFGITPERLGLPEGNVRTSEPFVSRIYMTGNDGRILTKQPKGYPFTITDDYPLKKHEAVRMHEGIDITSRPAPNLSPVPLDFKAGVNGVVVKAGDGDWGTISIQIADGSILQYLHTSRSRVSIGDIVATETVLGTTGMKNAGAIHLHIQAKDATGKPASPDRAFWIGQGKLQSPVKPPDRNAEFEPDVLARRKPKVVNGVVLISSEQRVASEGAITNRNTSDVRELPETKELPAVKELPQIKELPELKVLPEPKPIPEPKPLP